MNKIKITFNDLSGWLGLRAIDSSNDLNFTEFNYKENFKYDWEKNIKISSRHMTLIYIDVALKYRDLFIENCNKKVNLLRKKSFDILLTPFKGNTKTGTRRRKLDFRLVRAILERVYEEMFGDGGIIL